MNFLFNSWYVAAASPEIAPGKLLSRRLLDEPVVLYRAADGRIAALEDRCPHRSMPLSLGTLIGDEIRCGYHGVTFAADGRCTLIPGQNIVPPKSAVRAFPTVERSGLVWIWMGKAESADHALLPDTHWLDDPGWTASEGYHHVAANYALLNDNLLDLSHETYVHQRTIGNEAVADCPAQVRSDESAVYIERNMLSCHPPPFFQHLGRMPATAVIRRWQRTVYRPPCYIVIDVGAVPAEDSEGSAIEARVINLITPESAASSHYFWRFARNFRLDEQPLSSFVQRSIAATFDEDKLMLEAQQANLPPGASNPLRYLATRLDAGPITARRMLAARLAAEGSGT